MASEIRVNRLSNRSGLSTITFANGGVQFSGITTFANGDFRVGTGATILNPSTNEMQFHTGGSSRLTINSSGATIGALTATTGTFSSNVSIGGILTYEDVKNVDSVGVVTARTGVKVTGGDLTVGTAITASSVTGNVTNDVGITTYSGSAVWFKGATANKDMYWSHASGATVYKDNAQILMGDGSDLQIYHDSSHSILKNSTGYLRLMAGGSGVTISNADNSETLAAFIKDGSVDLYHNNSKKFETTSTGAKVTGKLELTDSLYWDGDTDTTIDNAGIANWIRFKTGGTTVMDIKSDQNVQIHDDRQLLIGASNDLTIYHSSSANKSYITSATHDVIHSFNVGKPWTLQTTAADKRIHCPGSGTSTAVELYHNGSKKLETISTGILVTGKVAATGDLALTSSDSQKARFGLANDLEIYHDGTQNLILGTAPLYIKGSPVVLYKGGTTEKFFEGVADGEVKLYHNGTKKLETTSAGTLTQGDVVITDAVYLSNASTISSRLTLNSENASSWQGTRDLVAFDLIGNGADHRTGTLSIKIKRNPTDSSPTEMMRLDGVNNRTTLYTAGSERLRIDSSGSLLIGATSNNGASNAGQTPVLYANGYSNLGGLRVKGGDDGNTIYKTGGDISIVTGDGYAVILKTNGSERLKITSAGKIGIGVGSPFNRFQCGAHTFSGGHAMYADDRVGMSNHGSLTGLMLASTYNDNNHPEYGVVFVQGPTTSSYNVWSISPDGPAKGNSLNLHYGPQATNIHSPGYRKFQFTGDGYMLKPSQPRAHVLIASNTTISNAKVTNWSSPSINVGSFWDTSNKRFVAPIAGVYMFGGNFRIGAPGSIRVVKFNLQIYNSSNSIIGYYGSGTGGSLNSDSSSSGYDHPYVSFTNMIQLSAGDYVELHLSEVATQHTSYIQVNNQQSGMWGFLLM